MIVWHLGCETWGFKMPVLAILRHEEGVRLDPDPLAALYAELGERGAEQVLYRALDEIAARLSDMYRQADEGQDHALIRSARLLAEAAARIGMATMARVAADLIRAATMTDRTAQAAILTRLARIADRSRIAVWDLRDMRM